MAGKGDTYRPVDQKAYDANYDLIYKKQKLILDDEAKESLNEELDRTSYSEIRKCCGRCNCGEQ